MANYLVTGGAGFIGSHIVEHLVDTGESVRVLDNFATGFRHNLDAFIDRVDLVEGDIRQPEDCAHAVDSIDYILHQAAINSVPRSLANPIRTHESNITGTLNLLIAARDAKVKRFVCASSSSVYGEHDGDYKSEELQRKPRSPYAASKAACEHYVAAFSNCFEMETVTLRYFNVFGPRQNPNSAYSAVIPLFITAALESRRPTVHGDGLQARDFTFVPNVVLGNVLAATADYPARGQVYNIACGGAYSVLEVLRAVNEFAGTNVKPVHGPARAGDVSLSRADITRARTDLGYEPVTDFYEGLRCTVEWYRHANAAAGQHP